MNTRTERIGLPKLNIYHAAEPEDFFFGLALFVVTQTWLFTLRRQVQSKLIEFTPICQSSI